MDPSQIDQVLANLVVNARDALSGVGNITIATDNATITPDYCAGHAEFLPGNYIVMTISDNGCGMDPETMARIFDPFFTTKGPGVGTGLGLSTVYGIVRQNQGFINVYSEPGHGTAFKIYLPRFDFSDVEPTAESDAVSLPCGSETIIVVEDELKIRTLAHRLLKGMGYNVLTAGTPEEALRIVSEVAGAIDLLLTDVVMPGMNGRELAVKLTAQRPGLKCLFMSGYPANAIVHHNVLDKDVLFLPKPFSMGMLAQKVREALDQP